MPSVVQVEDRIVSFLRTMGSRPERKEVAFYGGTFTAIPRDAQRLLLRGVQPFIDQKMIDGIRVSTRPDAIDPGGLDLLRRYGVRTIELGAQSMVDEILSNCHRGHTRCDVAQGVRLVRSMEFELGIQIMLGLPGEDKGLFLTTIRRVVDLAPDFVRIYPLLVLRGAPLEGLYRRNRFTPISLEDAVQWAKDALTLFDGARVPVIRLGLQGTPTLEASGTVLAGPYHPAFRSLVESAIFYDMAYRLLEGRQKKDNLRVQFRVAPGDLGSLKGERKGNLGRLKKAYGLESVEVLSDPELPRGKLLLEDANGPVVMSREELGVQGDEIVGKR
jgi:histone acetyltransferase (RNA polymerase elongator complex component)